MNVLSIETSCDDTAVSIVKAEGNAEFSILGDASFSQASLHNEYGGVFPNLAKKEHAKNLVPLLEKALTDARMSNKGDNKLSEEQERKLEKILEREPELLSLLIKLAEKITKPEIDTIAVTYGPGLEPALWVGINFAKALSYVWNIKLIPVNHMEGHILSALYIDGKITNQDTPILSLLVSGGHTELVLMDKWLEYKLIGKTLDDAVGEAYDKVARALGLAYPGGPIIAEYAEKSRQRKEENKYKFPRPMLHSDNYNFSFSGLKTAVMKEIDGDEDKEQIAEEFENAVVDVLIGKTRRAIQEFAPKSLIIGGGVSANSFIKNALQKMVDEEGTVLYSPPKGLTGDNSIMIAFTGYFRALNGEFKEDFVADSNLTLY